MKKRFGFLCLSILISSFMIYGVKDLDDSGLNSPDQYHLTRYALREHWIEKSDLEKQSRDNEEKVREIQPERYETLLKLLWQVKEYHGKVWGYSTQNKDSLHTQILMIATNLSEEEINNMLQCSKIKESFEYLMGEMLENSKIKEKVEDLFKSLVEDQVDELAEEIVSQEKVKESKKK